ncbi:alcohol dehydrogenase catalytic domain-containing protein [Actinopolymorpha rutila]|uniref:Threonine dehydrogenase-like Zn-dependent dehydrogenase n=1 Tax=Actinopolymorpha rutila TaxID=446787 RepID=A0A852ZS09_9ACTN|nr:threonine dehydrogenase-like Zn-dependent dehydrogenase [Actinopolymorpha rutila]
MPPHGVVPRFRGNGVIEFEPHTYRDPGDGELLLAVGANAICGTDRGEYVNGSPIVPGHEAAGVVVAAGAGTGVEVGTRGAVYLMDYCGECRSCRVGATNQCFAKRADVGQNTDGGYGPFLLTHETNFFPVDDSIPFDLATMLLDVMGTSGHALRRAELVRDGIQSVYVAGAGPIGLGLVVMARIRYGADFPIFVSDVSPWRRKFAESFGVTALDAGDEAALRKLAPDVAFDSSGRGSARQAAISALAKRGALICVGHGEGLNLNVSRDLISPERAVLGSEYFRYDEMPDNHRLLLEHRELIGRVITHTFPPSELPHAFELFLSGQTGKVVIVQEPAT